MAMKDPDPERANSFPEEHRSHIRKIITGTYKPDYNVIATSIEKQIFGMSIAVTTYALGSASSHSARRSVKHAGVCKMMKAQTL